METNPMLLPTLSLAGLLALGPPPDTTRWVVLNHGRNAGELVVAADGASRHVHYRYRDRNRGANVEMRYRLAAGGEVMTVELVPRDIDGHGAGPVERYAIKGDSAVWTSATRRIAAATGEGVFYRPAGSTPLHDAWLARYLLGRPGRSVRLLPGDTAHVEIVADTVVPTATGPERVRLAMIDGVRPAPVGVWLADDGELFASESGWFITVRPAAVGALPVLRAVEAAYRDALAERLAHRVAVPVHGRLVIRNGDVFDSERGVVRPRTTVVIEGERITAVGPADSVAVPAGATVIDATAKTVMPGMWDMHVHLIGNWLAQLGASKLAAGITTVRDLAADLDVAVSHRDRANAGTVASPRVLLGGFMEGPGDWEGPSEALVRTESEARAWIARYDSLGYRQIKLYNLVHPDLVPAIAEETHRRGMRLSGHVPRGLSVAAVIRLGFDEINHAAFLFSSFFPDSLFVPRMRPYSAVAADVAPGFDVDGPAMTALIETLRASGTVVDGTFSIWTGTGVLTGQGSPASASYGRLLKRLYDAGVTLVPGTDASTGVSFLQELELYQFAGIPAPEVLRLATLTSARVMGEDRDYGSLAPGKVADVVIVDGRPAERVADLRRIEQVVRAGRLYRSADLRAAIGEVLRRERQQRD
jgi:imidazolonepropionase-like amidohydrolase